VFQEFYVTVGNCHRKFVWYFPEIKSAFVIHDIIGGGQRGGNLGEKRARGVREAGKRGREAGFLTWRETGEIENIVQYFHSEKSKVAGANKIKGSYEPAREE